MLVAGPFRIDLDACHHPVHPVAYRAVRIVVEGIHARILKRAVGFDSVPALPYRRGAFLDGVEPGRIGVLEKQVIGHVQVIVPTERVTEVRSTHEPGGEVIVPVAHVGGQAPGAFIPQRFREEVESEGQCVGRLRVFTHTARLGDELPIEGSLGFLQEVGVVRGVFLSSQDHRSTP